jgi:hypothetical protein
MMVAASLALAGCGQEAVQMAGAGTSLQRAWKDEPTGYLVGAIGRTPVDLHSRQALTLCQRDFGRIATLSYRVIFGGVETRQIEEKDYVGESFALALPAGRYTICGSGASNESAYFYGGPGDLAIPLTIEAGKLNYIGRYSRVVYQRTGPFGWAEAAGGYWVVSDRQAADLPYILQRDPKLAGLPVVTAIPSKEALSSSPQFAP